MNYFDLFVLSWRINIPDHRQVLLANKGINSLDPKKLLLSPGHGIFRMEGHVMIILKASILRTNGL